MTAPTAPPYNVNNVITGAAVLYFAPKNTPLPADSSVLFDPTNWTGKTLTAAGATSITLTVTNSKGTATTAALASFATITAAAVATALQGLANVGVDPATGIANVTVTGPVGGPFVIVFANSLGPVTLTISGSTGGAPTITGGLWTPPGATDAGWTLGKTVTTNDINIEEQSAPVGRFVTASAVTVSGTVVETSRSNWQMALNAVKTQIAQGAGGSGIPGVTILTPTDDLTHYAVALESKNEFGFATRDYIPDTVQTEAVSVAFRRAANPRQLPVSFSSVCDIKQIQSRAITTVVP